MGNNDVPDWGVPMAELTPLVVPAATGTLNQQVTVPADCTVLAVLINAGLSQRVSIWATGGQSGAQYAPTTDLLAGAGGLVFLPVLGNLDNPVTVHLQFVAALSPSNPTTVGQVAALVGINVSQMINAAATGLDVTTLAGSQVTPEQMPGRVVDTGGVTATEVNLALASGATSAELVVRQLNQTIRVYGVAGTITPAAGGAAGNYDLALRGSVSGIPIAAARLNLESAVGGASAEIGTPGWIEPGLGLNAGEGIVAVAGVTPANTVLRAVIFYTQHV